jgi:hypothetical protein
MPLPSPDRVSEQKPNNELPELVSSPPKRRRGRPPKPKPLESEMKPKRKRGRPRKTSILPPVEQNAITGFTVIYSCCSLQLQVLGNPAELQCPRKSSRISC